MDVAGQAVELSDGDRAVLRTRFGKRRGQLRMGLASMTGSPSTGRICARAQLHHRRHLKRLVPQIPNPRRTAGPREAFRSRRTAAVTREASPARARLSQSLSLAPESVDRGERSESGLSVPSKLSLRQELLARKESLRPSLAMALNSLTLPSTPHFWARSARRFFPRTTHLSAISPPPRPLASASSPVLSAGR
jgi:hypothetical protein